MEKKALNIVKDYIMEHLDKSDDIYEEYIEVYTVWKCKALQNWKFLISSTILDGMYYEVTYNGDLGEWYLDAYKKFENRVIKDEPQTDEEYINNLPWMEAGNGEQTDIEIARAIVHKAIDDAAIAEDAYPDLRQKMHDAVDNYEPQTERSE